MLGTVVSCLPSAGLQLCGVLSAADPCGPAWHWPVACGLWVALGILMSTCAAPPHVLKIWFLKVRCTFPRRTMISSYRYLLCDISYAFHHLNITELQYLQAFFQLESCIFVIQSDRSHFYRVESVTQCQAGT